MSDVQQPMAMDMKRLKSFVARHLDYSGASEQKRLDYDAGEIISLLNCVTEVFKAGPSLVRMRPPLVVVGDIHGQFSDLLRVFALQQKKDPRGQWVNGALCAKFMFLGDYVDRGFRSLECACLLFGLKALFPDKFGLLRGNHETSAINKMYGFYDELLDRFGPEVGETLWNSFNHAFSWMPLAGLVGGKILCMHGGLSPALRTLDDIEQIHRPLEDPSANALVMDLLWADPMSQVGFAANKLRGVSVTFGEDAVIEALKRLKIDLVVRAHQVQRNGFGFFASRRLVTVFSAPRYQIELNNKAAVMMVARSGSIHFKILYTDEPDNNRHLRTESTQRTVSEKSSASKKSAAAKVGRGPSKKN